MNFNFFWTNHVQREELGALVSLEMGKIRTEGVGEIQEFIDIVSRFPEFSAVVEQNRRHLSSTTVRLCRRFVENDEWPGGGFRAPRALYP